MIYIKLRQTGLLVNHKRVRRLYTLEKLQVAPSSAQDDRTGAAATADSSRRGQRGVVDGFRLRSRCHWPHAQVPGDCRRRHAHEAVAAIFKHSIGGDHLVRLLGDVCAIRDRPSIIRTDNGKAFTGRAMLTWAYRQGTALRLIEPGKPNQNAYIESFDGRLRDECPNEHWFTGLLHAKAVIRAWVREYNEERPKKALGGLTPAAYARQLAATAVSSTHGL